jgi:hypothetical protein
MRFAAGSQCKTLIMAAVQSSLLHHVGEHCTKDSSRGARQASTVAGLCQGFERPCRGCSTSSRLAGLAVAPRGVGRWGLTEEQMWPIRLGRLGGRREQSLGGSRWLI